MRNNTTKTGMCVRSQCQDQINCTWHADTCKSYTYTKLSSIGTVQIRKGCVVRTCTILHGADYYWSVYDQWLLVVIHSLYVQAAAYTQVLSQWTSRFTWVTALFISSDVTIARFAVRISRVVDGPTISMFLECTTTCTYSVLVHSMLWSFHG